MRTGKLGLSAAFLLAGASSALAQGIDWIQDYQKGIQKAKAEGKAVFLLFYATW